MLLILDLHLQNFFSQRGPGIQFIDVFLTELSSVHHISHLSELENEWFLGQLKTNIQKCKKSFDELKKLYGQLPAQQDQVLDLNNLTDEAANILAKFLSVYSGCLEQLVQDVLILWELFCLIPYNNVSRGIDGQGEVMEVQTEFSLVLGRRVSVNQSLIIFFKYLLGGHEDLSKKILAKELSSLFRQFSDTPVGRAFSFPTPPSSPCSETGIRFRMLTVFDKAAYCVWYLRWQPMIDAAADFIKHQLQLRADYDHNVQQRNYSSVSHPNGRHLTDRTWTDYYADKISPLQMLLATSLSTFQELRESREFSTLRIFFSDKAELLSKCRVKSVDETKSTADLSATKIPSRIPRAKMRFSQDATRSASFFRITLCADLQPRYTSSSSVQTDAQSQGITAKITLDEASSVLSSDTEQSKISSKRDTGTDKNTFFKRQSENSARNQQIQARYQVTGDAIWNYVYKKLAHKQPLILALDQNTALVQFFEFLSPENRHAAKRLLLPLMENDQLWQKDTVKDGKPQLAAGSIVDIWRVVSLGMHNIHVIKNQEETQERHLAIR